MHQELKKIAIVGPESTGKSELAQFLAVQLNTCWVEEVARKYLNALKRPYQESDLLLIAHSQIQEEERLLAKAKKVLICDTNLMVIKIWSTIRYGRCHKEILDMLQSRHYDLHLLTSADIPWEADSLREHPHQRDEIWRVYKNELAAQALSHVDIKGSRAQRRKKALHAVMSLIATNNE